MTLEYGRQVSIIVADDSGNAIEFNQFKCSFYVHRGDFQTPNNCTVRILNLSPQTANKVASTSPGLEFTTLTIQAGYAGNFGLIFTGAIKQVRQGRNDAKDTYLDISAADSDKAYNFAHISSNLAAATAGGILKQIQNAVSSFGVTAGDSPTFNPNQAVRGRTLYGPVKSVARKFADENDCTWSIQDGALTFIPKTSYIQSTPLIVSPATGLIGVPEQTANGIEFRMLLNPSIKIGTSIQLQGTVNPLAFSLSGDQQTIVNNQKLLGQVSTNAQGLYYVMICNHLGDTRGNAWESQLTCLAVDASIPPDVNLSNKLFSAQDALPRV